MDVEDALVDAQVGRVDLRLVCSMSWRTSLVVQSRPDFSGDDTAP
ncbi:MAG: hypothetical protein R3C45_15620 [Phycisphaerales bacterium]